MHFDRVNVIGKFAVIRNNQEITPTASKQCQLLALLILRGDRPTCSERIADELWDGQPPPTHRAAIHTYITQLRRALHTGGASSLAVLRHERTYQFIAGAAEIDLDAYHRLRDEADAAERAGHLERQCEYAERALHVWSGPLLADLHLGDVLSGLVDELDQDRRDLLKRLVAAWVARGHIRRAHVLLAGWPAAHGDNIEIALMRIYCLAREGRRAEALALYEDMKFAVPSVPEMREPLRAMHADVVRHDVALQPFGRYLAVRSA